MLAVDVIVTVTTVVVIGIAVHSDVTRGRFALVISDSVGVPRSFLPVSGALKAAGATGLTLGLAGVPVIGVAAAAGLVLFFVGAVGVHLLAREHTFIVITVGYLALAAASLVLALGR